MAKPKTTKTGQSVAAFLDAIGDPKMRADCKAVAKMMREATGCRGAMWGASMVGFGSYDYRYASGREGRWFLTGFAPRKQALTLYIMPGFASFEELLGGLGKYRTGKSCLYLKSLDDVDREVLRRLIGESVAWMREKYG